MMDRQTQVERSVIKKYKKPIWHRFIGACKDYRLVNAGDKIAVCVSGGKDSFLLAMCLRQLQRHSDVPFELAYLRQCGGRQRFTLLFVCPYAPGPSVQECPRPGLQ